jgi:D-aminopeptidase
MKCTLSAENGTLVAVLSGTDVCARDVRQLVDDIAAAASKDGLRRVMCDATQVTHSLSFADILVIAKHAVQRAPAQGQFAVVCSPDDRERASFMETVVIHLGKSARVFADTAAARAWLDGSPAL